MTFDAANSREQVLLRRIKLLTWVFILGLVIGGATAIPLKTELELSVKLLGVEGKTSTEVSSGLAHWILRVREGLQETDTKYPFMAYGTDWLAFGHFMIAVAFVGALRHPVRNVWLFTFGMIACALIVPYAFIFGGVRGIPIYWRLIDCSFGVFGIIPVWYCRRCVAEIEQIRRSNTTKVSGNEAQKHVPD
jgi:hypothetical protein